MHEYDPRTVTPTQSGCGCLRLGVVCLVIAGLLAVGWAGSRYLLPVTPPDAAVWAGQALPLDRFHVKEEWERQYLLLSTRRHQRVLYHKRAAVYFPLFERELAARGLPDDLKYLAVAESALRNTALSHAGAAGLWQFIPETARRYGLRVDEDIDERLHTERSTDAALRYLADLYEQFGDWHLAAAAYNRGENGLERDLVASRTRDYFEADMPTETEQYVFRIAVIATVMQREPLLSGELFAVPATRGVSVTGPVDLASLAEEQGVGLRTLRSLNAWLVGERLPDGHWEIQVPL